MTPAPPVVVVTEPEFARGRPVFDAAALVRCIVGPSTEEALAGAVLEHNARHVIVGSSPYRGRLYSVLRPGAVIARYGVGHENVDKALATKAGLFCTNTPGVLDQSVAELTMLLILAAARQLTVRAQEMRGGIWSPAPGLELAGKTLAIVGTGPIGRAVGRAAMRGFGMRAIGCGRPRPSADTIAADGDFTATTRDFAAAVAEADFVSLHLPGWPENRHFLNAPRLAAMKRGAWLINTARGAVVDERALYDALASSHLGGAALDVFDVEPYRPADADHDFRDLPSVILVPHIGSNTADANRRMAERALRNVLLAEQGNYGGMDLLNRR